MKTQSRPATIEGMSDPLSPLGNAVAAARNAAAAAGSARSEVRRTAIWAVGQGANKTDVARVCGVTRQTLDRWITEA